MSTTYFIIVNKTKNNPKIRIILRCFYLKSRFGRVVEEVRTELLKTEVNVPVVV